MRAFLKSVMGALICASLLVEEVMPAAYAYDAYFSQLNGRVFDASGMEA